MAQAGQDATIVKHLLFLHLYFSYFPPCLSLSLVTQATKTSLSGPDCI